MFHRTLKYRGEQDKERHGGNLHWPGVHGLPFRGPAVPNLKQEELEQLPVVGEAFHDTFDLSDEEQSKQYRWIRDRARNGLFTVDYSYREHVVVDGKMKTIIYIEWTQLYVQAPPGYNKPGSNGNGRSSQNFTIRGA
jgi:hypothetical protein